MSEQNLFLRRDKINIILKFPAGADGFRVQFENLSSQKLTVSVIGNYIQSRHAGGQKK